MHMIKTLDQMIRSGLELSLTQSVSVGFMEQEDADSHGRALAIVVAAWRLQGLLS